MSHLAAYHLLLGTLVVAFGLFGGVFGMFIRHGSRWCASAGIILGLLAGTILVVYPAYADSDGSDYEEVARIGDRDPRMSKEIQSALADGTLSQYEHQRIVHMEDDLQKTEWLRSDKAKRDRALRNARESDHFVPHGP